MSVRLSKSKLIAFRQCPKRLWLEVNQPDLKVEDDSTQRRFEAGHRVGELAHTQYPDGVLIAPDNDLRLALKETEVYLAASPRRTLFEATFQAEGILVRADLLIPANDGWHMVEVKSSASLKDYHIEDAAIQAWVAAKAGVSVVHTSVQVVDSKWTYPGGNHYSGLLKIESVDSAIKPLQAEVPKWLSTAQNVAASPEPNVKMGKQCSDPFACSFQTYCESLTTPAQFPISWLPRLTQAKKAAYEAAGYFDLKDIPPEKLSDKHRRVQHATLHNEIFLDPLSVAERKMLSGTRYYIDFESIMFVVPIWQGTRPYQQVSFQWSCHIEKPDGSISHEMFLDLTGNDPSRAFAESLVKTLGTSGPILVFNQSFEKGRITDLANRFANLSAPLLKLLDRVVDLLPITREHFYHSSMKGSWSLKAVLPAIAPELDYSNLDDVADGGGAQDAYLEAIHADTTPERKARLEQALRTYCHRDTLAMVRVLHYLAQTNSYKSQQT